MVSKYALLDTQGNCFNVVLWDGNTSTWDPAPYTAVLYNPAVHVVQVDPTTVNQQAILAKALPALASNVAYLAIGSPTNAQVSAQVTALTRQVNALIRLVTLTLDSVSGT